MLPHDSDCRDKEEQMILLVPDTLLRTPVFILHLYRDAHERQTFSWGTHENYSRYKVT